jgi:hypothetical protein
MQMLIRQAAVVAQCRVPSSVHAIVTLFEEYTVSAVH